MPIIQITNNPDINKSLPVVFVTQSIREKQSSKYTLQYKIHNLLMQFYNIMNPFQLNKEALLNANPSIKSTLKDYKEQLNNVFIPGHDVNIETLTDLCTKLLGDQDLSNYQME